MPQEDVHLNYDEQIALETYVLRNYAHLLTPEERATLDGGLEAWWAENLERMHEWGAKLRFWKEPPPWQPAPIDQQHYAQLQAIVKRLQAAHGDEIRVAHCPKCGRIGRTPADDQCPWCLAKLR
jgi:hypothetical protein